MAEGRMLKRNISEKNDVRELEFEAKTGKKRPRDDYNYGRDRYYIESREEGKKNFRYYDQKVDLDNAKNNLDYCRRMQPKKEWRITYKGRVIDG